MLAKRIWVGGRAREKARSKHRVGASRSWMGMTALGIVCAAHGQQGLPIAGIHHFEVVLLGEDVECGDEYNTAYEVTDCGLVVGQRARQLAGGQCDPVDPSRRRIAFVYAVTPQFGIAPGNLVELPNPDPVYGANSAAFDVNESGLVVGCVGGSAPTAAWIQHERSALWQLAAAPGPTLSVIDPPPSAFFRAYNQGGFGRLESISSMSNGQVWAAGHFGIVESCGLLSAPRYVATAVRVEQLPAPSYRWEIDPELGMGTARAISRDGAVLGGARTDCGTVFECGGDASARARAWIFGAAPTELLGTNRTPDVYPANDLAAARLESMLPDGSSVGLIWDSATSGGLCAAAGYAWAPGFGTDGASLLESSHPDAFKGYGANDIESLGTGLVAGRLVAGYSSVPAAGSEGAIWFRPDSAVGWTTQDWQYRRVNTMISSLKSVNERVRVVRLEGMNRLGDCVGSADVTEYSVEGSALQTKRRAVLLRAVPTACVGDLNRDGTVGAQDVTMLLSYWCGGGYCPSPSPIADLNVDGQVGAADLGMLLNRWGSTCSWPQCATLVEDVPASAIQRAMESVDFASELVGLGDFAGYRVWREAVPAPIVQIVDEFVWSVAKGGS